VSKKVKLQNGDILSLLTQGIWEQCDTWDVRAAIDSAENEPEAALDGLERLILDAEPEHVDNYTAVVIFIDKVFIDPNKGKKLKLFLAIAIPVLVIIIVIVVILLIRSSINGNRRINMQTAFLNAIEYIEDENFPRATEELRIANELSIQLKDREFEGRISNYSKLVEAVINADDLFLSARYDEAQNAYTIALNRSRFTDNAAERYIERRLIMVNGYLSVFDFIRLGDILKDGEFFFEAEDKYLSARQLASRLNFADGRSQAMDALQTLYELMDRARVSEERAQNQTQNEQNAQDDILREASEMEISGDRALTQNDYIGANLFYTIARERFESVGDDASVSRIDNKLLDIIRKEAEIDGLAQEAARHVSDGDRLFDNGRYVDAMAMYILARNIYSSIQDENSLAIILLKIEACNARINNIPLAADESGLMLEAG
jgi:hypothetical protein